MTLYYPPATQKLITPGSNDPRIQPVGVVLHVAATEALSLYNWFNGPSGGIESHLYLRYNGSWEQYRDFEHEADAQYLGNSWVSGAHRNGFISVETQGLGAGRWTPEQMESITEFLLWASREFGFPLRKVLVAQPSSPAQGGVGYHTQFGSWSNVSGKTCPGPDRIQQFHDVLVPWMSAIQEDDVAYSEAQMIDFARRAVQAELGDENVGAFSDRIVAKVLAALPPVDIEALAAAVAARVAVPALDPAALATAVANTLAARLKD